MLLAPVRDPGEYREVVVPGALPDADLDLLEPLDEEARVAGRE